MMQGDMIVVRNFIANTAYEALRDYVFAVIPLFMLMGDFLAKCGAARDLFALINRLSRWLPGRLAIATVFANAVFAFVTGVSIAAAAAFSRIAYPEMKRYGYERKFALGCIAGSACLGMLIPPSVLMIVWGVLTEQAIGKIFIAGIIPGFVLVGFYCAYILGVAWLQPQRGGHRLEVGVGRQAAGNRDERRGVPRGACLHAARDRADRGDPGRHLARFLHAHRRRGRRRRARAAARALEGPQGEGAVRGRAVGRPHLGAAAPAALLRPALLARAVDDRAHQRGQGAFHRVRPRSFGVLAIMVAIWFVLGCLIDSISIILLTVPVFGAGRDGARVRSARVRDPRHPRDRGGLLTPPFGMLVFTVKAALPREATVGEIFRGSIPYWIALLAAVVVIAAFPQDRDLAAGGRDRHRPSDRLAHPGY